jgi:hydroxyacylglutathione hydrolase
MWDSLNKLAALPEDTLVYCGHDYTLENYEFASRMAPHNEDVAQRKQELRRMVKEGHSPVPSTIGDEKRSNIFLLAGTPGVKESIGMQGASDVEVFAELRRRKDFF